MHRVVAVRATVAALAALAAALVVVSCAPSVGPYVEALDGVSWPAGWELAGSTAEGAGGDADCTPLANAYCPSATRWYLVADDGPTAYADAKDALVDAGFALEQERAPDCASAPGGSLCGLRASANGSVIDVDVFPPGRDVGGLGLADNERLLVRIVARKGVSLDRAGPGCLASTAIDINRR